jgi:hypothetical protein
VIVRQGRGGSGSLTDRSGRKWAPAGGSGLASPRTHHGASLYFLHRVHSR